MRTLVREAPPEHFGWLCSRVAHSPSVVFRGIEVLDGDRIVGMVGYDSWTGGSVQMLVALESVRASRAILPLAFRYPFVQENKRVALAFVSERNEKSLSLCRNLGFREVYRIRDGRSLGIDLLMLEMRREECRWIPEAARA